MDDRRLETGTTQDIVLTEGGWPALMVSMEALEGGVTRITFIEFLDVDYTAILRGLAVVSDEVRRQARKREPDLVLPTHQELEAELKKNDDIPF